MAITPTNVTGFPRFDRPYSNITPFTYRDGLTFLEVLESLRAYMRDVMIPHLDKEIGDLSAGWAVEVMALVEAVNQALDTQTGDVNAAISGALSDVQTAIDLVINNSLEANDPMVASMVADVASATRLALDAVFQPVGDYQAFGTVEDSAVDDVVGGPSGTRDTLDSIYEKLGVVSDSGVSALIGDAVSDTRETLEKSFSTIDRQQLPTTVTHKVGDAGGRRYDYTVCKIHTGGKMIPGLLGKEYPYEYEKDGTSGSTFKPQRITALEQYENSGGSIIASGSGWETNTNIGEIRGAQIKDGIIYHDMDTAHPHNYTAIGYRSDGSLKCYSAFSGDTAASMVADGVIHSWAWGPEIVSNGVIVDLTVPAGRWASALATTMSGRQVIGQTAGGDIVLITVYGSTGTSGVHINELGIIAKNEGCKTAAVMDGGGSAQTLVNGVYAVPSSEDVSGGRGVADFLIFKTRVDSVFSTKEYDAVLAPGIVGHVDTPGFSIEGGTVRLSGGVKPSSGKFENINTTVFTLPPRFRPIQASKYRVFLAPGDAANYKKVVVDLNGDVSINASTVSAAYIHLDGISFRSTGG